MEPKRAVFLLPGRELKVRKAMTTTFVSSIARRRLILTPIGIPVLVTAWWAFRPEKLWINQKVDEPAPFASTDDPQPLYTGALEGKAHQTSGRNYLCGSWRQTISASDGFHNFQWP